MRKKNWKGRCTKRTLSKCQGVCRTYDDIQHRYADLLQERDSVLSFQCNVFLEDEDYTTDFLITGTDGELSVRECVYRNNLTRPSTAKLLDLSRDYWRRRGVVDWGIVIEKEVSGDEEE
jgi:hypothetical protein